jgi:signal peptidase I
MKGSEAVPIGGLGSLLVITWVLILALGLLDSPSDQASVTGVENWTKNFRGYEVYLDERIEPMGIRGGSMRPTFDENDNVLWVDISLARLQIGDIIVFEYTPTVGPYKGRTTITVHRVIDIVEGWGAVTQGDNIPSQDDGGRTDDDLIGLVIGTLFTSSPGWYA